MIFTALAVFACCACSTIEEIRDEEFHAGKTEDGIFFELPVPAEENSESPSDEGYLTKTYYSSQKGHFAWSETDTIGVVSIEKNSRSGQIPFWIDDKSGDVSVNFTGGDWGLKANTKYCAYYPYAKVITLDKTKIPFSVKGQVQSANGAQVHDRFDCLCATASTSATTAQGYFTAAFNYKRLSSFFRFKIKPEAGTYTRLVLSTAESIIPVTATFNVTATKISLTPQEKSNSLTLSLKNIKIGAGEELVAYLAFIPADWTKKKLTVSLYNSDGECFSYSMTPSKAYVADKIYTMNIGTAISVDPSNYLVGNTAYGMYDLQDSKPVLNYTSGKDMYSCSKKGSSYNFRIMNPGEGDDYKFISLKFSGSSCTVYAPEDNTLNGKKYNVVLVKEESNGDKWYKSTDNDFGFIVNFCE